MTYVWATIVSTIVVLIIYGMVSSKLRERRAKRHSLSLLPEIADHITPDTQYRVVLTSGTIFPDVRFLGISQSEDKLAQFLPFTLQHWLVLQKADGKRLFIRPTAVKYYEEL
jgi:hypothetical protein